MKAVLEMNPRNIISRAFQPLHDLPCWQVKRGHGSFLTMEFGEPRLIFGGNRRTNRRTVHVRGQWHLWIYCCDWEVFEGKELIGSCENKKSINHAAAVINGQKLSAIKVFKNGRTDFWFEYGTLLRTKPYDRESEQWMLYEPNGMVLTFNWNGCICHQSGDTPAGQEEWQNFNT